MLHCRQDFGLRCSRVIPNSSVELFSPLLAGNGGSGGLRKFTKSNARMEHGTLAQLAQKQTCEGMSRDETQQPVQHDFFKSIGSAVAQLHVREDVSPARCAQ
jgi:hypothetical protein